MTATPTPSTTDTSESPPAQLTPGECAPLLQQLCPACYGGREFGRSFDEGGDIHIALDGNLHHRHLRSVGEGIPFHKSQRFLSKDFVNAVGDRVEQARGKPAKTRTPKVPDEAIDACTESYRAARGDGEKKNSEMYDENGLMALVCRHDIPIFVASIDTPGEQQKYSLALLEALFSMIPQEATVASLYDIGCVLDRSLSSYELLPAQYTSRLQLATSVMHAYGHQWSCQLLYNPRLRDGLGLTDGEGTERLWSRLRGLIGIERHSSSARRLWLLDRQLDCIADDLQTSLGSWQRHRLHTNVQKKETEVSQTFTTDGIPLSTLKEQWKLQCEVQMSACAHAPAHLKKHLTKVLQLQSEIEVVEASIATTKSAIKTLPSAAHATLSIVSTLEKTHNTLKAQAEELYLLLNLPEEFRDLKEVLLEFMQTLILARDLKVHIWKNAVGSFFEWERLDTAIGGRDAAIGTKLHQVTCNSISKRKPALLNGIHKFNGYCATLKNLHKSHYSIPIPKELPTDLNALRDPETSHLWEDVWIEQSDVQSGPLWLADEKVRRGIRAMLHRKCCQEERVRLQREGDNMCRWFREELLAIELALKIPEYACYARLLELRCDDHLHLAKLWASLVLPHSRLDGQIMLVKRALHWSLCPSLPLQPQPFDASPDANESAVSNPAPANTTHVDISEEDEEATLVDAEILTEGPSAHSVYLADVMGADDGESSDEEEGKSADGDQKDKDSDFKMGEIVRKTGKTDGVWAGVNSSTVEMLEMSVEWTVPSPCTSDNDLLPFFAAYPYHTLGRPNAPRAVTSITSTRAYELTDLELRMLDKPTQLNGDCINACAAVLQNLFLFSTSLPSPPSTAQDCTIFTTYLLPKIAESPTSNTAWRFTQSTEYWRRNIWLIPIHMAEFEHWDWPLFM
ncbi:hypothetical protein E1B28_003361 [Marasmius oreades]|uniref:Uncharacterized protein n=1 Tax=Marasmius oreades TaxID=181124 RepID=A0A9P7RME4_9AGAR|nr:uncharacterized protein E1B28_003361 [Marasmius oreades]KAG7085823.1 hypothetical protein E1B28_003361 [Marasmius oreades]